MLLFLKLLINSSIHEQFVKRRFIIKPLLMKLEPA